MIVAFFAGLLIGLLFSAVFYDLVEPMNDGDDINSRSPFVLWLLSLPDQIELAAERGSPVVVPDPGTDHGRALYQTLGVTIEDET